MSITVKIGLQLFKPPDTEYVDPNSYSEHFIENIGQSVRYVTEIQNKSFPNNSLPICQKWVKPVEGFS